MNRLKRLKIKGSALRLRLGLMLGLVFLYSNPSLATSVNPYFTFEGQLFDLSGNPNSSSAVSFRLQVLDPTGACLLYEEVQTGVDLSDPDAPGAFELKVGSIVGSAKRSANDPAYSMVEIFSNRTAFAYNSTTCNLSGLGYTPSSGDKRILRVYVDDGGGEELLTPDQDITSVPFAQVAQSAETLQGKVPGDFVAVNSATNLTQTNVENVFTNYTTLMDLINGNSSLYVKSTETSTVDLSSGGVIVADAPAAGNHAVNQNYVDARLGGQSLDTASLADGKSLVWDNTNSKWVVGSPSATDATKLPLDGSVPMSGALDMGANGITNVSEVSAGSVTISGNASVGGSATVNDLTATNYITSGSVSTNLLQMSGQIDMSPNGGTDKYNITNLQTPVNASDAVTKSYSDTKLGGAPLSIGTIATGDSLQWDGTQWVPFTPSGGGGVTSVTGQTPINAFTSGSGDVTISLGQVPLSYIADDEVTSGLPLVSGGSAADPNYGSLSLSSTAVSGTLPIEKGGTGATTVTDAQTNLGLGTAATKNTGTSANQIPLLDASGQLPASTETDPNVQAFAKSTMLTCPVYQKLEWDSVSQLWTCEDVSGLGNGGGTQIVSVSTGGKVGIGIASPAVPLHVNWAGSTLLKLQSTSHPQAGIELQSSAGSAGNKIYVDDNDSLYFKTASSGGSVAPLKIDNGSQSVVMSAAKMSGVLDMSPNGGTDKYNITNLQMPVNPSDAVTKSYSDTKLGGAPLSIGSIATGDSLQWDGAQWVPFTPSGGGGGVTSVTGQAPISATTSGSGDVTISLGQVPLSYVADDEVTAGLPLVSGGSAADPNYGSLSLSSTAVSGTLPIEKGGTGATTVTDAQTNLGLGTAATKNTGTSANQIPLLDASGQLPASTETDPNVQAFAKTNMLTCPVYQKLEWDSVSQAWSCEDISGFGYGGSQVVAVGSGGSVGIGTSLPENKLHVYSSTSGAAMQLESGQSTVGIKFQPSTMYTSQSNFFYVNNSNDYVFGTPSGSPMQIFNTSQTVKVSNLKVTGTSAKVGTTLDMSIDGGTTKNKIVNLDTPVNPSDAATKDYVDAQTGGSGPVAVRCKLTANSSTKNLANAGYLLDFDTEEFDTASAAAAGCAFTAPTSGYYQLNARLTLTDAVGDIGATDYTYLRVNINDTNTHMLDSALKDNKRSFGGGILLHLTSGDVVRLHFETTYNGIDFDTNSAEVYNWMSIHQVK